VRPSATAFLIEPLGLEHSGWFSIQVPSVHLSLWPPTYSYHAYLAFVPIRHINVLTFWLQIAYFGQNFGVLAADSGQIQKLNILIPQRRANVTGIRSIRVVFDDLE